MDHLEEIRARLSIEDLVGGYVQLKKAGRSLKGLCPFHSEKTPSFIVSPDKGIAWCFGCSKGGDIFRFVQLIENVEFKEAVKILAGKANVRVPEVSPKQFNERLQVISLNEKALEIFCDHLKQNKKHWQYLTDRGLTDESISKFRVGYAPDNFHALKDQLVKQGHNEAELVKAGLLNQRSMADQSSFDRFRSRIIFPIMDHQGNVVGFGGRAPDGIEPKYLNSPDTAAYQKGLVLYGLDQAKEAIKEKDLAIVVEGYIDVIMAHQAGTQNVIATSGTALTPQQIRLLKRFTRNIAFAFDQDTAGLEATRRAIELAQEAEVKIKVIINPLGKDPADCIREDPEKWRNAAAGPIDAMDFYFRYAGQKFDVKTLEGRKAILELLLPLIRLFTSSFEQDHYATRLAHTLRVDTDVIWQDLKKKTNAKGHYRQPLTENPEAKKTTFSREEYLLGFLISYPEIMDATIGQLMSNIRFDPATEKFYTLLKSVYTGSGSLAIDKLKARLSPEECEKLNIYSLLIDEHYPDFPQEMAIHEALKLVKEINRKNLLQEQQRVRYEIRDEKDEQARLSLLNQYNEMLKLSAKLH